MSTQSSMALSTSTTSSSSSSPYVSGGDECPLSKMKSLEPLFFKIFLAEAEERKDEVYADGKTRFVQAYERIVNSPADIDVLFRIAIDPDPKEIGFRYRRLFSSQIRELLRTEGDPEATLERIRLIVKEWFKVTNFVAIDLPEFTYDTFYTLSLIRNPSPIGEGEVYPMGSGQVFGITIGPWITRMKARPLGLTLEDQKKIIFMNAITKYGKDYFLIKWSVRDILPGITGTASEFCLRLSHYPVLDTFIVSHTRRRLLTRERLFLLGAESQINATFPDVCKMIKERDQVVDEVLRNIVHMQKEFGERERKL